MTSLPDDRRLPGLASRQSPLAYAFAAALLLEVWLLGAIFVLLPSKSPPPAVIEAPMRVSLVTLPTAPPAPHPPAKAPPKQALPTKPIPKPVPKPPPPKPAPHPHPKPRPKPVVRPPETPQPPHQVTDAPVIQQPVVAAQQPAADSATSEDALSLFLGQVTEAVRDAEVYPPVARMMKQHGKAIVEFTYFQGHASDVALRDSSGYPLLDRAAIEAVQSASYPAAPAILGHSSRRLTIGVEFNIVEGAAE